MRKPIRIALMAGTASVIAAVGASAAFAVQGNSQQTPKAASYNTSATVAPAPGQVSAQQARQIAQQRVPGARVTETERDREHGRAVWEVELTKQHHEWEVAIDAASGKVISVHYDSETEQDDYDSETGQDD